VRIRVIRAIRVLIVYSSTSILPTTASNNLSMFAWERMSPASSLFLEVTPRGLKRRLNNWINTDDDIQEEKKIRAQEPLAKTTFYKNINQKILSMYCSEKDNWFKAKNIKFPENYSLEKNRESLNTLFPLI
jgi:hypothetical protein